MERAHWVKPELVVQVRFTEWTAEGLLRHPVYLGTRDDKDRARRAARGHDGRAAHAGAAVAATAGYRAKSAQRAKGTGGQRPHGPSLQTGRVSAKAQTMSAPRSTRSSTPCDDLEKTQKDGDVDLPNGDRLRVTNLAKVFWKSLGITKGELLRYYAEVSPLLLPAVDDRPLVMKRFPNGVDKRPNSTSSGTRKPCRPASGARCCRRTSSRSPKKARAIG